MIFKKVKCPGGLPGGGMLKLRFDRYIKFNSFHSKQWLLRPQLCPFSFGIKNVFIPPRYWFLLFLVLAPVVKSQGYHDGLSITTRVHDSGLFALIIKIHLPDFLLLEIFCKCRLTDKYIFPSRISPVYSLFFPIKQNKVENKLLRNLRAILNWSSRWTGY